MSGPAPIIGKTLGGAAGREDRRRAVNAHKRRIILEAAGRVFSQQGLEGASLRAIAREAGYTPAALYFHYADKEEIYGDLLAASLQRLDAAVAEAAAAADGTALAGEGSAAVRLRAAAFAFFDFYRDHPSDLQLGFYLFRGMRPLGLTGELNSRLNAALCAVLDRMQAPLAAGGLNAAAAKRATAALFAQTTGLLLLLHTGRIKLFGFDARDLLGDYLDRLIDPPEPSR